MLVDVSKWVLIEKHYKTEINLRTYIFLYRSFELLNKTRVMRISSTDLTHDSLIATDEGTSSYIASRWP